MIVNVIDFPDIHEEWYELYDPHGNYIDRIEDYIQWLEIRVQIKEKVLRGYYIVSCKGIKCEIDHLGNWELDKLDPYSVVVDLLMKLI